MAHPTPLIFLFSIDIYLYFLPPWNDRSCRYGVKRQQSINHWISSALSSSSLSELFWLKEWYRSSSVIKPRLGLEFSESSTGAVGSVDVDADAVVFGYALLPGLLVWRMFNGVASLLGPDLHGICRDAIVWTPPSCERAFWPVLDSMTEMQSDGYVLEWFWTTGKWILNGTHLEEQQYFKINLYCSLVWTEVIAEHA